jgi:hypothetical protein
MQRSNRENGALRQLKTEETELQLRLTQVRKAIAALDGTHSEPRQSLSKCRADLLREYLLDRPEGVRAKDVPAILKAMGHASVAAHESTNWLSPSQLPPDKRYFSRKNGIITLDSEFGPAFGQVSGTLGQVHPLTTNPAAGQQEILHQTDRETSKENGASIDGVNKPRISLTDNNFNREPS